MQFSTQSTRTYIVEPGCHWHSFPIVLVLCILSPLLSSHYHDYISHPFFHIPFFWETDPSGNLSVGTLPDAFQSTKTIFAFCPLFLYFSCMSLTSKISSCFLATVAESCLNPNCMLSITYSAPSVKQMFYHLVIHAIATLLLCRRHNPWVSFHILCTFA